MIIPTFKLEQDAQYLHLFINAPFAKISDVDLFIDECDFRFYCKPYYLRLNLPGKIVDSSVDNNNGSYDFDKNRFNFKFLKETPDEHFEGLDLVTKLLTHPKEAIMKTKALIEEIPSNNDEDEDSFDSGDEWFVDQTEEEQNNASIQLETVKYGFAMTKSNVFAKLSDEYRLIIDLPEPDSTPVAQRKALRLENETEKFIDEHYLADLYDGEYIEDALLKYRPWWYDVEDFDKLEYTQAELDCLKELPKKSFLLEKKEKLDACIGLVDILYSYCYSNRINCGEKNVEAGWTIAKLSSTLSWFDSFESLDDVLIACFRRSLCFPLYRNWKLSQAILQDLLKLLSSGKKAILKCLVDIRATFNEGESRYLLNNLFINDYCVWIQYFKDKHLKSLVDSLKKVKLTKSMLNLDLECLEMAAKSAIDDEDKSDAEVDNEEEADRVKESDDEDSSDDDQEKREQESISHKIKENATDEAKSLNSLLDNLLNISEGKNASKKSPCKIIELN